MCLVLASVLAALGSVQQASAGVTVSLVPVADVTVTPSSVQLAVGASTQLAATPRDASRNVFAGRRVIWTSSHPTVASVSSSGLVTPGAPGTATITAMSEGLSSTAKVFVASTAVASPPVTWRAIGEAVGVACTVVVCPEYLRHLWYEYRWKHRRQIGPRLPFVAISGLAALASACLLMRRRRRLTAA